MKKFPENIHFKFKWRSYQQKVLDDLHNHLDDDHLHIIAPPGSGKTVLGLEVALRINKPTLILAPTLAIRNQWVDRFCELFLQMHHVPEWISMEIHKPAFLTVITYQGLHAASMKNGYVEIVNKLKELEIKTVIVDEAHHLKNEWWHTLIKIKKQLDPIIVGLTATPPYDVSATEWQRYIELTGPVDSEISIPELVLERDLCPHQDCVWFGLPSKKERAAIKEYKTTLKEIYEKLISDEVLISAIENHPVWQNPSIHLEWIYDNLSWYSACLIYLHATGTIVPDSHREVVGEHLKIPTLDLEWLEIFLDFYLFKEKVHFQSYEDHRWNLEKELRRANLIEKKTINLTYNKKITDLLALSSCKLGGIKEIVAFESAKLKSDLRMVILTDYIRKEFLVNSSANTLDLDKIGVLPIFEKLRRENNQDISLALICGSLLILPKYAEAFFSEKAKKYGIINSSFSKLPFDEDYSLLIPEQQIKNYLVKIVTELFQEGRIHVLIGTKSLLGEGWDAPAINSLILASFVGSFVLSNQMRGRAIRSEKNNPEKTSNIWHLITIDPYSPDLGPDFSLMKRRFKTFVGISHGKIAGIENGIKRMNFPLYISKREEIESINNTTFSYASDRALLIKKWDEALKSGNCMIEEIKIPVKREVENKSYKETKALYLKRTFLYFSASLSTAVTLYFESSLRILSPLMKVVNNPLLVRTFIFGLGFLLFGWKTFKYMKLYVKYRDISKDVQNIGNALLATLIRAGIIHTDISELSVFVWQYESGEMICHLEGGNTYEKSVFILTLKEILDPVKNPRYVIVRKNRFSNLFVQKDYHSVPDSIGRNKQLAEYFRDKWDRNVGDCDLIYTRTIAGRKVLLKSRIESLAVQLEDKVEPVNNWK